MGVTGITGGRHALPQNILSTSVSEGTGVFAARREVKNRYMYGVAQTPTQLLGRQRSDPSLLDERHLDFPPKPCSNSIFKPSRPLPIQRSRMRSRKRSGKRYEVPKRNTASSLHL